jgi:hypothetical protein
MPSTIPPSTSIRRLIWALGVLAVVAAGLVLVRLYQPPRLYDQYLPPMRSFLSAAIALDSTALVATGASAGAITWGLRAGRDRPGALRELASGLGASWGGPPRRPPGNSLVVLFRGPRDGVCYTRPLTVTFAGAPSAAHVLSVAADCLNR